MSGIVGVVLGAGLSERMGRQKQLLPYRSSTLIGEAVAQAEASQLDRVIVVLGAAAIEVEAALEVTRAEIVRNLEYQRGNLSSLIVGVEAAGEHEAVVHLLGDMPDVDATLIDLVLTVWRADRRMLAVTRYRDRRAHPILLSAAATSRLAELEEPKAVWRLVEAADSEDVLEVSVDRLAPIDVDTPEDYELLLGRSS